MAESGASVCVVEGDLRRPRLLTYLGLEGSVGLTDVLIGRYELDDVLQPFGAHSLTVLGAGATPPNPSELLGSTAMRTVLDELRHRFDYVLIDGAPVLPVTDSTVLTRLADGAIIVAGSGIVSKDQFDHALETFETVNGTVLGIVINRIPRQARGGYYDYRYEYRPELFPHRRVEDRSSSSRRGHDATAQGPRRQLSRALSRAGPRLTVGSGCARSRRPSGRRPRLPAKGSTIPESSGRRGLTMPRLAMAAAATLATRLSPGAAAISSAVTTASRSPRSCRAKP